MALEAKPPGWAHSLLRYGGGSSTFTAFSAASGLTESSDAITEMRSPRIFDLCGEENHFPIVSVMPQPPASSATAISRATGAKLRPNLRVIMA